MRRSASLVLGLCLLSACGGGGGGGGDSAAVRFAGTYHAVQLQGQSQTSDVTKCATGTVATTSATTAVFGPATLNDDGIVSSLDPYLSPEHDATSAPDLSWSLNSNLFLTGGMTPDGTTGGLASSGLADVNSGALCLVRASTGRTTSEMAGPHHVVALSYGQTAIHRAVLGAATLDVAGVGTLTVLETNTDGTIGGSIPAAAISVAVDPDGHVELSGATSLEGGLRADGRVAILGGGPVNSDDRLLEVFVRKATSASVATLVGGYTVVGLGWRPVAGLFEASRGTLTADGAGTATESLVFHAEGVETPFVVPSLSYSVGTDGNLNVLIGDRNARGAVAADGSMAVVASVVTAGAPPAIYLLFRR